MKVSPKPWLVVMVLASMALVMIPPVSQSTRAAGPWYVVPNGNDGNDCLSPATACFTINGAIGKASPGDTVYVAVGTYTGIGDEVVRIDRDITLAGGWNGAFTSQNGTSTIDGQDARLGIAVDGGVTAIVERFTVRDGDTNGSGGGISNSGTLMLKNSVVNGNTAHEGGGIATVGILTLDNSTVSENTADEGGGIYIAWTYGAAVTLNNSTISGNVARETGAGVWNMDGSVTLNNTTVTGNKAQEIGGGIWNDPIGTVSLQNTILSGNVAIGGAPDCSGTIGTSGYNLVGSISGCTFSPTTGDLINVQPKLGQMIGSPGYHPLFSGSPAIDAGNPEGCTSGTAILITDQRGAARVGRCDIGAYEYTTPGPVANISTFAGTPQRTPPYSVFGTPLQVLVLDGIGTPVHNAAMTFTAPPSGASGTFADSGTFTTTAVANENGLATAAVFAANALRGSYTVTATVGHGVSPTIFSLSNFGWYVAQNGNDSDECQTATTPCATVAGVLRKSGLIAGDTVLMSGGTHVGAGDEVILLDYNLRLSGGWDESFTTQNAISIIDGEGTRRGITVDSDVTAVIERFVVQNGYSGEGSGIRNGGSLVLNDSTVSGNSAAFELEGTGRGGGIRNSGTLLTLNNSVVGGNSAFIGGGIYNGWGGTVILNNSTINENGANVGGIYNEGILTLNSSTVSGNTGLSIPGGEQRGGGIQNSGILVLNNSTVSGNTAIEGEGHGGGIHNSSGTMALHNSTVSANVAIEGGGIYNDNSTVTLQNTLLAGNITSGSGLDCAGTINSDGYNLIGNTAGCTFAPASGDLTNIDPQIGPLLGTPGYHFLLSSSPAIDAGNPAGCTDHLGNPLPTDQRGALRPVDGNGDGSAVCDIGAYEFDPDNPPAQVFLPMVTRRN